MRYIVLLCLFGIFLDGNVVNAQPPAADSYFRLTLEETRPIAGGATLLFAGVLLWGTGVFVQGIRRYPPAIAWRASFRAVGWIGLVVSAGLILLLFLTETGLATGLPWTAKSRVVELVIPLVMAVQAALVFSPDDEPALEVMLACPRKITWVLIERLLVLALIQGSLALIGVAISTYFAPGQDPLIMIIRWIPPTVLLTGFAIYITVRSRVAAFGATVTGLIWFVFAFFSASLLPDGMTFWPLNYLQPFIWIINPYLEPTSLTLGDYWLNRLCVLLLGANLIALTLYLLRDEERLLLGTRKSSANQGG
ncbi:MAG: hypothetical protein K8L99_01070 [Anaerolineae bacterium]|nr:hypothetical protein [Anaerolineae bacterium]